MAATRIGAVEAPYRRLGGAALAAAADDFALGSAGAGAGATTANLKGGLGSASMTLDNGVTVAALAAVNAVGQATVADGPHFWAALFEAGGEFGGCGLPAPIPPDAALPRHKRQAKPRANTTLAVVATDALLTKPQAKRLAITSHGGFARALWPVHTPFDGDLVFVLSTGQVRMAESAADLIEIGAAAAACVARAIARGIYEATPSPGDRVPTWTEKFGSVGHGPEKWVPVFGKDHAPTISWSGMAIRRRTITLWAMIARCRPHVIGAADAQGHPHRPVDSLRRFCPARRGGARHRRRRRRLDPRRCHGRAFRAQHHHGAERRRRHPAVTQASPSTST